MTDPTSRVRSAAGVISRSTSPLSTTTSTIRRPVISRSRSRAIVSVSGSSGTDVLMLPLDLAPPDVGPVLLAGEAHPLGDLEASELREFHARRYGADREDAPARGDE